MGGTFWAVQLTARLHPHWAPRRANTTLRRPSFRPPLAQKRRPSTAAKRPNMAATQRRHPKRDHHPGLPCQPETRSAWPCLFAVSLPLPALRRYLPPTARKDETGGDLGTLHWFCVSTALVHLLYSTCTLGVLLFADGAATARYPPPHIDTTTIKGLDNESPRPMHVR